MKIKTVYRIVADIDPRYPEQKVWNRITKLWEFKNEIDESECVFHSKDVAFIELREAENAGKQLHRHRLVEDYVFNPAS